MDLNRPGQDAALHLLSPTLEARLFSLPSGFWYHLWPERNGDRSPSCVPPDPTLFPLLCCVKRRRASPLTPARSGQSAGARGALTGCSLRDEDCDLWVRRIVFGAGKSLQSVCGSHSNAGASIESEGWLLARRKKRWGVYVKSYSENQGLLAFALNGEFIFLFLVVSK